jgi:hypothetical protein
MGQRMAPTRARGLDIKLLKHLNPNPAIEKSRFAREG